MKAIFIFFSLFISIYSFAEINDPMAPVPFENVKKIIDPEAPIFRSIESSIESTVIFNPQANEMSDQDIPIYFHSTSNPKAICKKYGFYQYIENSLVANFANFNNEFIIVKALDFKDELRLIIPKKTNNNNNHKHMVGEISCY